MEDDMNYVCLKRLTAGGAEYLPGDPIPGEAILSSRVRTLISSGMIAEADVEFQTLEEPGETTGSLPVVLGHLEDGSEEALQIDAEQLQSITDIMTLAAKDAAKRIEDEVDENVLYFLQKVDSRKTVKEAAEKQLTIIHNLQGDETLTEGQNEPKEGAGE